MTADIENGMLRDDFWQEYEEINDDYDERAEEEALSWYYGLDD